MARLEAHDAAAGRGNADGSRRVRSHRHGHDSGGHRRGRAAARAARNASGRHGIHHAAEMRVVAGDAVGELMQVGEAHDESAGTLQSRDHLGVPRAGNALECLAAATEGHAFDMHEVLDRHRHTRQEAPAWRWQGIGQPRERVQVGALPRALEGRRAIGGWRSARRFAVRGRGRHRAWNVRGVRRRGSAAEKLELRPVHLEALQPCRGALAVAIAEPAGVADQRVLQFHRAYFGGFCSLLTDSRCPGPWMRFDFDTGWFTSVSW